MSRNRTWLRNSNDPGVLAKRIAEASVASINGAFSMSSRHRILNYYRSYPVSNCRGHRDPINRPSLPNARIIFRYTEESLSHPPAILCIVFAIKRIYRLDLYQYYQLQNKSFDRSCLLFSSVPMHVRRSCENRNERVAITWSLSERLGRMRWKLSSDARDQV